MARHEADREDLMREATALRERVEMTVSGEPESVVAGFRSDGRLSLYFGPDPAYHFDSAGRLRRAFCAGELYRSQGTTLARLQRQRSDAATTLERHDLTAVELAQFVTEMRERLEGLRRALEQQAIQVLRVVPADGDILNQLRTALPGALEGKLAPALR